jgi:hypothetical protein
MDLDVLRSCDRPTSALIGRPAKCRHIVRESADALSAQRRGRGEAVDPGVSVKPTLTTGVPDL